MMTLRSNKQKMKYSLFVSSTQEYELDEDGNIVYVEVDGEMIPVKVGETEEHYATPVDFKACITSELNELHMKAFGVDQSSIYSTLTCKKGYLPLEAGTLIWRESKVEWEDEAQTIPKADSADYTVCGVMLEGLEVDLYLLQRKSNE